MSASRKRLVVLLACLGLVMVVAAWSQGWLGVSAGRAQARRAAANRGRPAADIKVAEVRIGALDGARADPLDGGRNPFRFRPAAPPPPPPSFRGDASGQPGSETAAPAVPAPPPPPPPIPYKFIGILAGPDRIGRIAVLSDGRAVMHGREGDIIEGRFKLLKIGEESVQMEYIDGRGRQTIRLSGG